MVLVFFSSCGDLTQTAPLRRYATNLYAMLHKPRIVHTTSLKFHNTRVHGRSRRGTLSKMASFIVDSCKDQRFSLETWDGRTTIAWGRCTHLTVVDQFGIKISGFTSSCGALGRLLKKNKNMMTIYMSDFSWERRRSHNRLSHEVCFQSHPWLFSSLFTPLFGFQWIFHLLSH